MGYKYLCHLLYEEWKLKRYTGSIEDLNKSEEPYTEFEQEYKGDYTKYDKIMRKLKLNKGEKETLNCYMQGIGFVQQAKMFSLNPSTIWRRRKSMQNKYLNIVHTL